MICIAFLFLILSVHNTTGYFSGIQHHYLHAKSITINGDSSTKLLLSDTVKQANPGMVLSHSGPTAVKSDSSFIKSFVRVIRNFEEDKEDSRKLRRTVFSSSDWKKHRSSARYFRELTNLPRSGVIRGLIRQALLVSLFSSFIVGYNLLVELKFFRHPMPLLSFPALPFTLTSSSLGLLLVFRTNTAYARWREGRNYWSHISAKTFDVMRQSIVWMSDKETVAKTIRYLVAFAKTTKWHLTHRSNLRHLQDELNGILTDTEISEIMVSKSKPQFVLLRITRFLAAQNLIPNVQSHMDRGLIELGMALENCDRIYTTPIPLVYTRMTARFLVLWLITFPMTLYNEFCITKKWLVPIVSFMNSLFLLGIDDLGVQIEEPFSILPLANICYNIQSSAQMVLQTAGIDWFQSSSSNVLAEAPVFNNNNVNATSTSSVDAPPKSAVPEVSFFTGGVVNAQQSQQPIAVMNSSRIAFVA